MISIYHFNLPRTKYHEPSDPFTTQKIFYLLNIFSFSSNMRKYVNFGWSLNLNKRFLSYTKHYPQKIGYI